MHVLSEDNALAYLRERGWIGAGPARVEVLSGGVSNIVLRVETGAGRFVLKQSCPQLRTRDAWFSDLDRIYREQEVMEVLEPLLPHATVPKVLFSDRDSYVFAMSHAPPPAEVWKALLLAGQVDLLLGEQAGHILGTIHESLARRPEVLERFADRTVFEQLRVDPFYRRIQERRPEVAAAVEPLIEQLHSVRESLCHGDYSPKNLLIHPGGFTLVDYETAHRGDPAMDLGFFLSHLLLKAFYHAGEGKRLLELTRTFVYGTGSFITFLPLELTRAFWRGYGSVVTFRPLAELQERGIAHCGLCLLARIDGTSPVDYLPEKPKREAVRRLSRQLLLERLRRWEEVLCLAGEYLERLSLGITS
jgi:aminoglycoside phosphotransferase (APT) family kinase protein